MSQFKLPQRIALRSNPRVYVGATGTFCSQLPGEPMLCVQGTVLKIVEGPNYAVVAVQTQPMGEVRLLKY